MNYLRDIKLKWNKCRPLASNTMHSLSKILQIYGPLAPVYFFLVPYLAQRFSFVMFKHIFLPWKPFFIHYLHCQFPVTLMRCCGSRGLIVLRSIHPSLPLEAIYLIEVMQCIGRTTEGEIAIIWYTILYKRAKIVLNCEDVLMSATFEIPMSITMWSIFRHIQNSKRPTYCQWIL